MKIKILENYAKNINIRKFGIKIKMFGSFE